MSSIPRHVAVSPASPTLIGRALLLIGVAAVQSALATFGYAMVMTPENFVPLWPPTGVLLALMLATDRRVWPWMAVGSLLGEMSADLLFAADRADPALQLGFALTGVLEAAAGAVWLQLIFDAPELLLRMRNVIAFVLMLAGVSFAGAVASMSLRLVGTGLGGFTDLQLWWTCDYLGMLLFAPPVLALLCPTTLPPTFARIQPWESPLQLIFLTAVAHVAFGSSGEPSNLAEVPYITYPVIVWIAFRVKPPQLVLVALLIVAYVALFHTAAARGPFASPHFDAFGILVSVQLFLVVTTVTTLLLASAVFERRQALLAAHASDERYRSFLRSSHDAIWRVEIDPPLPLAAEPIERERLLREHARIAEHNDAYSRTGGTGSRLPRPWRQDSAWFGVCSRALAAPHAIEDGNVEAKLHVIGPDDDERIMLCELSSVVEANALLRVWGSAMDITAQERSQSELEAQRTELRSLTSQLMLAEEKARRATAADLHDGIGQNLSAIIMWQAGVREQGDENERVEILEHIRAAATESLQWTREIIADLSPPGLYDMGLESALSSLVGRVRERHALDVVIERCELPDDLGIEIKVTLFQCLRELLANVVKHAGASRARINVHHDGRSIRASVSDDGRGLDPARLRSRPSERGGFGLFTIRERLIAIGGTLTIACSDAGGARLTVTVPHTTHTASDT